MAFAAKALAAGGGVLVHCSFGRGRSALVAAAIGVDAGALPEDAAGAVAAMQARRRSVRVKADQLAALGRFIARRAARRGL